MSGGCSRCKRSLPPGTDSSLCKRCVTRTQTSAVAPPPAPPPPSVPAPPAPPPPTATPTSALTSLATNCSRCKRSLPPSTDSSLCKRCLARDESRAAAPAPGQLMQSPAAPTAAPTPEPDRKDNLKPRGTSPAAAPAPTSNDKGAGGRSLPSRNEAKRAARERRRQESIEAAAVSQRPTPFASSPQSSLGNPLLDRWVAAKVSTSKVARSGWHDGWCEAVGECAVLLLAAACCCSLPHACRRRRCTCHLLHNAPEGLLVLTCPPRP